MVYYSQMKFSYFKGTLEVGSNTVHEAEPFMRGTYFCDFVVEISPFAFETSVFQKKVRADNFKEISFRGEVSFAPSAREEIFLRFLTISRKFTLPSDRTCRIN